MVDIDEKIYEGLINTFVMPEAVIEVCFTAYIETSNLLYLAPGMELLGAYIREERKRIKEEHNGEE